MNINHLAQEYNGNWFVQQTINDNLSNSIENLNSTLSFDINDNALSVRWNQEAYLNFQFHPFKANENKVGYISYKDENTSRSSKIGIYKIIDKTNWIIYRRHKGLDIEENIKMVNLGLFLSTIKIRFCGHLVSTSFKSGIKMK
uniref:hypothetical protein n=1 Tax=Erythrolobus coxiae TaxID=362235 RepID=UPI001FCE247E|nr:hypothetical protein MW556_pgp054 [Erythrolobus coxiae]UNJ17753.1 hypothetical protein [Erythrolobus coxiae]